MFDNTLPDSLLICRKAQNDLLEGSFTIFLQQHSLMSIIYSPSSLVSLAPFSWRPPEPGSFKISIMPLLIKQHQPRALVFF